MASAAAQARPQRLDHILFAQGFGSRRECAGLVAAGLVRVAGPIVTDPAAPFTSEALTIEVEGQPWTCHDLALVLLHKPAGYECSQKPSAWPSVLLLLPTPLRRRGLQSVGRLDVDTTGLLLLTDDGALIHRFTSPKRHLPKVYEVTVADPLRGDEPAALAAGVVLDDDPRPAMALDCAATGSHSLRMGLTEGRYHQVKRMLGALGHRVTALHRSQFGALRLPDDLGPGAWRWLPGAQSVWGEPQSVTPPIASLVAPPG